MSPTLVSVSAETSTSSPIALAGAGVLNAGPATLSGVMLRNTHATNAGVFLIYDNDAAASGTVLFTAKVAAGAHVHFIYPGGGVFAWKGLYFLMTGSPTVEGSVFIS